MRIRRFPIAQAMSLTVASRIVWVLNHRRAACNGPARNESLSINQHTAVTNLGLWFRCYAQKANTRRQTRRKPAHCDGDHRVLQSRSRTALHMTVASNVCRKLPCRALRAIFPCNFSPIHAAAGALFPVIVVVTCQVGAETVARQLSTTMRGPNPVLAARARLRSREPGRERGRARPRSRSTNTRKRTWSRRAACRKRPQRGGARRRKALLKQGCYGSFTRKGSSLRSLRKDLHNRGPLHLGSARRRHSSAR